MKHLVKAVSITAGGIAVASALTLGIAYGLVVGLASVGVDLDIPLEGEDVGA